MAGGAQAPHVLCPCTEAGALEAGQEEARGSADTPLPAACTQAAPALLSPEWPPLLSSSCFLHLLSSPWTGLGRYTSSSTHRQPHNRSVSEVRQHAAGQSSLEEEMPLNSQNRSVTKWFISEKRKGLSASVCTSPFFPCK